MDKENVGYINNQILYHLKKKEIQSHAIKWMNLKNIMLSKINLKNAA